MAAIDAAALADRCSWGPKVEDDEGEQVMGSNAREAFKLKQMSAGGGDVRTTTDRQPERTPQPTLTFNK
jgi:hypothetical protein